MPEIPQDFVEMVSNRYIELYEKVTGTDFVKDTTDDINARVQNNVNKYLNTVL